MSRTPTPDNEYIRQRRHLHDAAAAIPDMDSNIDDGSFLVGWLTIMEFASPAGHRWFCTRSGTDGGDCDLTPWQAKGLLYHALDDGSFEAGADDDETG